MRTDTASHARPTSPAARLRAVQAAAVAVRGGYVPVRAQLAGTPRETFRVACRLNESLAMCDALAALGWIGAIVVDEVDAGSTHGPSRVVIARLA